MSEYAILVNNLSKTYHKKTGDFRMSGVDLGVLPHQFISIMGPSGCGKSLLLNMIAGIETPDAGTIELNGTVYEKGVPAAARKQFGFAFQEENLLNWRTVEANLMFPMECFKLKKTVDCAARTKEMLELVGLEKFGKAYPHELSGGMRQRVGFARALMHDPGILLLDQPFGALDAITRKMLGYDLLNIWKKTQKTVIMVTNNVEEAMLLSSKVYFMYRNPDASIQTVVDVDIPLEARGEHIAEYPGYEAIREELNALVHNLNISVSSGSVEA